MQPLSGDQLASVFPFHITVNTDLRVTGAGKALVRRDGELVGSYLTESFDVRSARHFPRFTNLADGPIVIVHRASKIALRGAFVMGEDQATFLGTIWADDLVALLKLGIEPHELSHTDPTGSYLAKISRRNDSLRRFQKIEQEMRDMRRQLREAKDEAESALRAKSGFLSVMSHELRTPLNAIIGSMELLSDRELGVDAAELVSTARISADQLLERVNDILDLIELDRGSVVLDEQPLNLQSLVEGVVNELRGAKKVDVVTSPNLPQLVAGDPRRLRRIVRELVGNAVKYGDRQITVRVGWIPGRTPIELEVSDDGPGIDDTRVEELFEPFTMSDDAMNRRHGGIGLGLAIVRRLARLMGGDAEIENSKGTRFIVRLALEPAVRTSVAGLLDGRVLVVDDNLVNRKIAGRFLEKLGLKVQLAADGQEAIELAERETYDLILMDLQMPMVDGTDAARNIRSNQLNSGTPIVALSANDRAQDRERCRDAGMNDFLAKPLRSADLERIVQTFVAR